MNLDSNIFIHEAKKLLNTAFKYKSASIFGCDCAGFVSLSLANAFKNHPFIDFYQNHNQGNYINDKALLEACKKSFFQKTNEILNFAISDIIVFNLSNNKPNHIGIVSSINPVFIIHSYKLANKITSHILDDMWTKKIHSVYSLNKIV